MPIGDQIILIAYRIKECCADSHFRFVKAKRDVNRNECKIVSDPADSHYWRQRFVVRCSLTRTRSATAAGSERESKWKGFNHGKFDHTADSRSLHRLVRYQG